MAFTVTIQAPWLIGASAVLVVLFVLLQRSRRLAHYSNENALANRLKQQELMSDISQSLISKEPMSVLINDALKRTGEFLGVTRVLVAVNDKDKNETHPVYTWFSSESWRPDPAQVGFKDIIKNAFPRYMPEAGFVPAIYCRNIHTEVDGKYKVFDNVGLKSFVWAPLYVDNEYWGMLSVEECLRYRVWSESDAQLVGMVSSAIAGAAARDIMEKGKTEALDQAVRASKAKGDFLSNMSHEIRTPMNAIIGMTSIGKSASDIERKNYCFGKIEDASTHLLGVINDILDMSKIEANKLELSPESFNFEKMLQRVVNVVNFRIDEKDQTLSVHIDREIPNILIGDDQRLAQVIANLLGNAVKFTPERGAISLNTHFVKEEGGFCILQIEVTDTGIGITPEQQSRLFDSFQQAESSTSRKFGGTGLGLAISKRIVEMMGGRIWIVSETGKGSSFIFTVLVERGPDDKQSLLSPGVNWSNVRVLVVDDSEDILDYFKEIASRLGFSCDVAGDAKRAIGLIAQNGCYDVYFVDWKMPDVNGIDLTRKIRETGSGDSVVIMISATEWNVIEDEAKGAGVDKFLPKPLFPSAIADTINECLGVENIVSGEETETDNFEGRRVLLAEDIEINREIVMTLLAPTGLSLDCAENGVAALRMFSESPEKYDMIFMDVQMPEMDGYEATRRIRALDTPYAREIPIIAMTANVFREDIDKCHEVGMNGHVGKPIDLSEVLAKLREYLARRHPENLARSREK
ncbi:MAG: response regulator [Synergistaceae bacterium]|jgi:signal transduction histidine kinase/CheY-like chemotaxis protein|nr:response regulator [Synergistaceae bacterium]